MQESPTRVPDVLDALYAFLSTPLAADDWQVFDGPIAAQSVEFEGLIIGDVHDAGDMAVDVEVERAEGLGNRYREFYEIQCSMWSVSGDEVMKPRRDRLRDGLAIVEAALKADQTVDGAVDLCILGASQQWRQLQTDMGAGVEVWFSLRATVMR